MHARTRGGEYHPASKSREHADQKREHSGNNEGDESRDKSIVEALGKVVINEVSSEAFLSLAWLAGSLAGWLAV